MLFFNYVGCKCYRLSNFERFFARCSLTMWDVNFSSFVITEYPAFRCSLTMWDVNGATLDEVQRDFAVVL